MALLNKLPGFKRAPAGLERAVLRRLPLITIAGTALLLAAAFGSALVLGAERASAKLAGPVQIALIGLLVLHWNAVFTVALVCVIIVIAKGRDCVAGPYSVIDAERPHH